MIEIRDFFQSVDAAAHCPRCDTILGTDPDWHYCINCGLELEPDDSQSSVESSDES